MRTESAGSSVARRRRLKGTALEELPDVVMACVDMSTCATKITVSLEKNLTGSLEKVYYFIGNFNQIYVVSRHFIFVITIRYSKIVSLFDYSCV